MALLSVGTRARVSWGLVAMAALLAANPAAAGEFELAQSSGCFVCHRGAENRMGPSFKEVARKYAGQADARTRLADHIVKGTGPAGQGWMKDGKAHLAFMPANSHVTPADADKLAAWLLGISDEVVGKTSFLSDSIQVSGLVAQPLKLSLDALRKLPQRELVVASTPASAGSAARPAQRFKGVLLRDVLEQAGIVSQSHFDFKKMVVVLTASDSYRIVFSWSELFKSPVGDGVLVFFEKNGQALADNEGRFALVSTQDADTSSRYVKWLKAIDVRRVAD